MASLGSRFTVQQQFCRRSIVQHRWFDRAVPCLAPSPACALAPTLRERTLIHVASEASQHLSTVQAAAIATHGKTVVVAIDNSRDSWQAVKWTLENLYKKGDVLHLLHVIPEERNTVPVIAPGMLSAPFDSASDSFDELQETMHTYTRSFIDSNFMPLAEQHLAKCEVTLVAGSCNVSVGDAICRKSEELAASVVVVSSHKKMPLQEFVFGSVSRHVAQHCKQPTLIFHSDTMSASAA